MEKAGGRDFLEGVKELRKSQAPLEVAAGRLLLMLMLLMGDCLLLFLSKKGWRFWRDTLLLREPGWSDVTRGLVFMSLSQISFWWTPGSGWSLKTCLLVSKCTSGLKVELDC